MGIFEGEHEQSHERQIMRVVRVFWSVDRAWHGDEVTLSVRTENVADGTTCELRIVPRSKPEAPVDKVTGVSITGSKLDHKYTIDWKTKPVPKGASEFVFKAKVGPKLESELSDVLVVELSPPAFSF